VKKLASHFLVLIFAMQPFTIYAQMTERPKPGFSLSIAEVNPSTLPSGYSSGYHRLLVTYTNISDVDESFTRRDSARGLDMIVLLDGAPAKETDSMRDLREERHPTKPTLWAGSVPRPATIKPGESVTFPLEISGYFDMSKPGTYEITVSKETLPDLPEKNVTVKSNTITIVVPEPGAVAPK
jgi:hypothetical protein